MFNAWLPLVYLISITYCYLLLQISSNEYLLLFIHAAFAIIYFMAFYTSKLKQNLTLIAPNSPMVQRAAFRKTLANENFPLFMHSFFGYLIFVVYMFFGMKMCIYAPIRLAVLPIESFIVATVLSLVIRHYAGKLQIYVKKNYSD